MKKKSRVKIISLLFSVCLLFVVASSGSSEDYTGQKGLKSTKAVFDVRINNPESAALHLKLLHQAFKGQDAVVIFSGPSVKLVTKNREGFSPEEQKLLNEISSKISEMSKDGIKLEICLIAAQVFGVDPASILPEIKHVDNGWLSLIDYQANGYYLVPAY